MERDLWLEAIHEHEPEEVLVWVDREAGAAAILVIDDRRLGPAAGGIRTKSYPRAVDALRDALNLARAMTLKCALAGLEAGGGKLVLIDRPELDRRRAFEMIGRRVEALNGAFRTAGDLGTTLADLTIAAKYSRFVHLEEQEMTHAVARGLLRCIEAAADRRGKKVAGLKVAVQGAGAIGAAAVEILSAAGCEVFVSDLDEARAARTGAAVVPSDKLINFDADVLAPCAVGGVIGAQQASEMRAWALIGAANNIVAGKEAAEILRRRNIEWVPDPIASAGAVISGICHTVMCRDPLPLIDALGATARRVLDRSEAENKPADVIASELAAQRLSQASTAVSSSLAASPKPR